MQSLLQFRAYRKRLRRRLVRFLVNGLIADHRPQFDAGKDPLPRRIVILRPNHRLGNTLMLTPLLTELERCWPAAEVAIVSAGRAEAVFRHYHQVGQLFLLPHKIVRRPWFMLGLLQQIRRQQYDLVIEPVPDSQGARLLRRLVRARRILTVDDDAHNRAGLPQHMALRPVAILRHTSGQNASSGVYPPLDLRLTREERMAGQQSLLAVSRGRWPADARVIGLYADANGSKRLPEGWWRALILNLQASRRTQYLIEVLAADNKSRLPLALPQIFSGSIRELGGQLAALDVLVTGDCGIMHLAQAVGTPTIAIFRSSDLKTYRPYGPGAMALLETEAVPEKVSRLLERAPTGGASAAL